MQNLCAELKMGAYSMGVISTTYYYVGISKWHLNMTSGRKSSIPALGKLLPCALAFDNTFSFFDIIDVSLCYSS